MLGRYLSVVTVANSLQLQIRFQKSLKGWHCFCKPTLWPLHLVALLKLIFWSGEGLSLGKEKTAMMLSDGTRVTSENEMSHLLMQSHEWLQQRGKKGNPILLPSGSLLPAGSRSLMCPVEQLGWHKCNWLCGALAQLALKLIHVNNIGIKYTI